MFDNYDEVLLKHHTCDRRGNTSHSPQFVMENRTIIDMGLKEFLNDIKTKHDIIIHLSIIVIRKRVGCYYHERPRYRFFLENAN